MDFPLFLLKNISLILLATPSFGYAQDFYKWIDNNGSTHYTPTPPPKEAKKLSQVTTYSEKRNSEHGFNQTGKNNNSPLLHKDEPETVGNTFTILTSNGVLEIPPLKDGESHNVK
ncbi:DUF4124 domain-containing protein [Acinetobacter sp. VNK23]|uniref:DUF4124 domain-containing protein n=1 Tax=Acinetobacter thutiue TaxID=2998078 RepID=UPI00257851FB|nr:DUF4124 domain-containing protein [Acinetobacter thutiue]MDM1020870.1 DUF4124 domain-containing protein [Acinetobacter thutiue]